MATTNVSFRVDSELKKEAEELFQDFGLSMNSAFTMFLRQSVREQSIPFFVTRKAQNDIAADELRANGRKLLNSQRGFLEERLVMYPDSDYSKDKELDWGEPVGDEVW